jgi:hypothetical protein
MGQSILSATGATLDDSRNISFLSLGAPRAGWVGVRYDFGGESKKD